MPRNPTAPAPRASGSTLATGVERLGGAEGAGGFPSPPRPPSPRLAPVPAEGLLRPASARVGTNQVAMPRRMVGCAVRDEHGLEAVFGDENAR